MAGTSNIPVPIGQVDLEKKAKELGIEYFIPTVFSLHLGSKGPLIPSSVIRDVQQNGYGLHGLPEFGYGGSDPECRIVPDPDTLIQLPWKPSVGWLACFVYIRGKPSPRCPRAALVRQIQRMRKHGYFIKCGFEAEFMLFKEGTFEPTHAKADAEGHTYFDPNLMLSNFKLFSRIFDCFQTLGWGVYQVEREYSGGQYELNYGYTEALKAADRFVFYKFMAKALAEEEGARISFMPLYRGKGPSVSGCGLHINTSIWNVADDTSAMHDSGSPLEMSDVSRHFTAGVMKHLKGMTPVMSPTPNGFKRMHIFPHMVDLLSWGIETKTVPMRVAKVGDTINRFEFRLPDSSCNPYLAVATMLAAGLDGMDNKWEPDPNQRHEEELLGLPTPDGAEMLPRTLPLGIQALKADQYLMTSVGQELLESFIKLKEYHLVEYEKEITEYELTLCDVY